METSPTGADSIPTEPTGPTEPTPDILTFADIMSERDVVLAKEASDKAALEGIGARTTSALKPTLIEWVMTGCPNVYPIFSIDMKAPDKCSDGVVRTLPDYITFCSGKTINEHVDILQAKFPDIVVSFSYNGTSIAIVVSRVQSS